MCGAEPPGRRTRYCSDECRRRMANERKRALSRGRREAGLCIYCGGSATPGRATCAGCRRKYRRRVGRRVSEWRSDGKCVRCGRDRERGYRECAFCIAYRSVWRERE